MPPPAEAVTLTTDLINICRVNGAFTSATVEAFGVSTKMTKGWPERLVGTILSRARYREALRGKYIYAKKCFQITQS